MMPEDSFPITLHLLGYDDLEDINGIIEAAIETWDKPERVKRLALPSYRYDQHDQEQLSILGARNPSGQLIGIVSWEDAEHKNTPSGKRGLLLHGLYVLPESHGKGVGTSLFNAAKEAGIRCGLDGLLVKAERDAQDFFLAQGMRALVPEDPQRDYPHRLWIDLSTN